MSWRRQRQSWRNARSRNTELRMSAIIRELRIGRQYIVEFAQRNLIKVRLAKQRATNKRRGTTTSLPFTIHFSVLAGPSVTEADFCSYALSAEMCQYPE